MCVILFLAIDKRTHTHTSTKCKEKVKCNNWVRLKACVCVCNIKFRCRTMNFHCQSMHVCWPLRTKNRFFICFNLENFRTTWANANTQHSNVFHAITISFWLCTTSACAQEFITPPHYQQEQKTKAHTSYPIILNKQ